MLLFMLGEKGVRTNNKRQVWRGLQQAVQAEKALVLFPSGKLSQPRWPCPIGFMEDAWRPGVVIPQEISGSLRVVPFRLECVAIAALVKLLAKTACFHF